MKIAVIRQRYVAHGGAERYASALVQELARRGHEIHIFAHRWDGESMAAAEKIAFHRVPMVRVFSFLRAISFAFSCKKSVERAQFDVVFSLERTMKQDIYRAGDGCHREWLAQRKRYISPLKRATLWMNPLHPAMLWLEKRTFSAQNTRLVIANSHRGKDEIVRHYGFPADRIHVIHNGVDCERFKPANRSRGDGFVLLFVGTGFERKGLAFCIRALKELPQTVRLRVVGKGNRRRYERLARRLGVAARVDFAETMEKIESVYASADVFVLPAIYEPFANACLEAMACGVPVVTSRINGASEIIEHGKNGAIIDEPNDIEALAAAIRMFLDRKFWADASAAARKTAEAHPFSANVEQTLKIIELACG
jgi:UDP-glucose:(heptosyl)LPS alpha-1,3-glucosyltransferase